MSDPITINVVTYQLSTDSAEYQALAAALKARGLNHFEVWHTETGKPTQPGAYTVETDHLFDNQTNTAEGFRVFDWYDGMYHGNRKYRTGHYVVDDAGFAELQALRRATVRCGYCGHQRPAADAPTFHLDCLGSQYLEAKDLHLTRYVPVSDGTRAKFPALTADEQAMLQPIYTDAQINGRITRDKARIAKLRESIKHKFETTTANAQAEYTGMLWLLDHGINTDNVIYYGHMAKFGFGWRKAIDAATAAALRDALDGFPCDFEIKGA